MAESNARREVTARMFAAARQAAGVRETTLEVDAGATLSDLIVALREAFPALAAVLDRCSFLVDGVAAGDPSTTPVGSAVDVLPPFAGG